MPSSRHEGLVELFRNRLSLAVELLRDTLGVALPDHARARDASADLSQPSPPGFHADHVVVLEDARGEPVQGIIVEVQLGRDPDKRFAWPAYQNLLRRQLRAPVCLLVLAPDAAVARWAAEPIDIGQPGSTFTPLVLEPGVLPRITRPEVARRHPELAVLSVLGHGHGHEGLEVALAAAAAVSRLDSARATDYHNLILTALDTAARRVLEALMASGRYEYEAEFVRKHFDRGFGAGEAEGQARGKAEGKAEALLAILTTRGLDVPAEIRDRILACDDTATLDRWIARAVTAPSAAEVVD